jgi:hypothetical protein
MRGSAARRRAKNNLKHVALNHADHLASHNSGTLGALGGAIAVPLAIGTVVTLCAPAAVSLALAGGVAGWFGLFKQTTRGPTVQAVGSSRPEAPSAA